MAKNTLTMMRYLSLSMLVFCALCCWSCGQDAAATEGASASTETPSAPTAAAPVNTAPAVAPKPGAIADPNTTPIESFNKSACDLYSIEEAQALMSCASMGDTADQVDSRGGSRCTFICNDPFMQFSVSAGSNENGYADVIQRRKGNAAMEVLEIEGADAAFLVPGQMRFDVYKGNVSISVQTAGVTDDPRAAGLAVVKTMLSRL